MDSLQKDHAVVVRIDGLLYRGLVESAIYAEDEESGTEFTSISVLIGSSHNHNGELRFGETVDVTEDNVVGVLSACSGFDLGGSSLSFIGMFLREFAPEIFFSLHWCEKPHSYRKECWVAGGLSTVPDPMAGTAIEFLLKKTKLCSTGAQSLGSSAHVHF